LKIKASHSKSRKLLSPLEGRNKKAAKSLPNSKIVSPSSSFIEEIVQRNSQKKLALPALEKRIYERKHPFPEKLKDAGKLRSKVEGKEVKKPRKNRALEKLKKLQLYGDPEAE